MKRARATGFTVAGFAAVMLLGFGCASPNVNPPAPRANTGYVDFYTESVGEPAWDIQRFDASANEFKLAFSELKLIEGGLLRLAFAPGRHRLRVTFLNRVIAEPAVVEVDVRDGQVSPVQVTLAEAGTSSVQTRQESRGATYRGRSRRRAEIGSYEAKIYRVSAATQESRPYQLKEQMPYARQPTK